MQNHYFPTHTQTYLSNEYTFSYLEEEQAFNKEWDSKTHSLGRYQLGERKHRAEARGLPMASSSTHTERPHPDHSPSAHSRVHPYTRIEGSLATDGGRRRKKATKVHF